MSADLTTYEWPGDEFAWVTDTDWFIESDFSEPVTTVRRRYRLIEETEVTWTPHWTLCTECHGEGEHDTGQGCWACTRCDGDGRDPDAGTWKEVHHG